MDQGPAITVLVSIAVFATGLVITFGVISALHKSLEAKWSSFGRSLNEQWKSFDQRIQGSLNIISARFSGSLLTFEELMAIERQIDCKEIWVVTGSLEGDIREETTWHTIKHNVERGVTYKYILPENPKLRGRAEILASKLPSGDAVKFEYISPGPLLEIINIHDFVIYDPAGKIAGRKAYMNVPIETGKKYFLALSSAHAETVYSYLKDSVDHSHA
jgi:hypothetical protein